MLQKQFSAKYPIIIHFIKLYFKQFHSLHKPLTGNKAHNSRSINHNDAQSSLLVEFSYSYTPYIDLLIPRATCFLLHQTQNKQTHN